MQLTSEKANYLQMLTGIMGVLLGGFFKSEEPCSLAEESSVLLFF